MKILRVGRRGAEKPVIDYAGELRDVSVYVTDVDRAFLNAAWGGSLRSLGRETMPWVDPASRRGACLERVGRVILAGSLNRAASKGPWSEIDLRGASASAAGANDPIFLPAHPARFMCEGGLALALRGSASADAVSGVCLYLNVIAEPDAEAQRGPCAVVSSALSLLSLGPCLVDPSDWPARRVGLVEMRVNERVVAQCSFEIDKPALEERIADIMLLVRPAAGDVALLAADSAAPIAALTAGDRIAIDYPGLGSQEHLCVADERVAKIDAEGSAR